MFADLLDFQTATAAGRPLTLFFNGVAGNSQFHLHWQAVRVTVPLERALDSGRVVPRTLVRDADGRLQAYDHGLYAGFLACGSKAFVGRWAERLVDRLTADPLTRGAYNMVLLQPKNGEMRLAVVPRRLSCLKPNVGSLGPRSIGAVNVVGLQVLPRATIPEDFDASLADAIRATLVRPSELSWTDELTAEPRHTLPHPSSSGSMPPR